MWICLDGEFVPRDQAKVSVFDHGLLYGDGVFEGIRAYHGRVFRLAQHVRRLYDSARTIQLQIPLTPAQYGEVILETCRRNQIHDGYIRAVVTRGVGDLGLDPRKCPLASYFIIAAGIQLYPESCYEQGLKVVTCATRRNDPTALDPAVKSLNYLNNILGRIEVNRANADEGLMLNSLGNVSEATGDNIFVVRDGVILTPPIAAGILQGITRDAVIELARAAGFTVKEEFFNVQVVYNADECFLTGTAAEVIPVRELDGREIGDGQPGAVTRQLIAAFRELVKHDGTPIHG
ncbi:MAG: branched-chain-amino-acid transaminase [Fimbriimonadaceae bacterium]|nr:branched-chain-amino-acid transaminase [Fimbriimonadaceae bacterium]